jgi:hypothetical protein
MVQIIKLMGIALGAAMLTACAPRLSPEQLAAQTAAKEELENAACLRMGAVRGTDAYTACRLKLLDMRVAAERETSANERRRIDGMSQTLDTMATNIRPVYPQNNGFS